MSEQLGTGVLNCDDDVNDNDDDNDDHLHYVR